MLINFDSTYNVDVGFKGPCTFHSYSPKKLLGVFTAPLAKLGKTSAKFDTIKCQPRLKGIVAKNVMLMFAGISNNNNIFKKPCTIEACFSKRFSSNPATACDKLIKSSSTSTTTQLQPQSKRLSSGRVMLVFAGFSQCNNLFSKPCDIEAFIRCCGFSTLNNNCSKILKPSYFHTSSQTSRFDSDCQSAITPSTILEFDTGFTEYEILPGVYEVTKHSVKMNATMASEALIWIYQWIKFADEHSYEEIEAYFAAGYWHEELMQECAVDWDAISEDSLPKISYPLTPRHEDDSDDQTEQHSDSIVVFTPPHSPIGIHRTSSPISSPDTSYSDAKCEYVEADCECFHAEYEPLHCGKDETEEPLYMSTLPADYGLYADSDDDIFDMSDMYMKVEVDEDLWVGDKTGLKKFFEDFDRPLSPVRICRHIK